MKDLSGQTIFINASKNPEITKNIFCTSKGWWMLAQQLASVDAVDPNPHFGPPVKLVYFLNISKKLL